MKTILLTIILAFALATPAKAQNVNIPDANFKAYLIGNTAINTNGDAEIQVSEAEGFEGAMDIKTTNNYYISSIIGIEFFVNISELITKGCYVEKLDLSSNRKLVKLDCSDNKIVELDLSKNTSLISINCSNNRLTKLTLGINSYLTNLQCSENQLVELDLSNNTSLMSINCSQNRLTKLKLGYNNSLTNLQCSENQLVELDVSGTPNLIILYCNNNQLNKLDIKEKHKLNYLYCYSNRISTLDLTGNSSLSNLLCYKNNLTEIIFSSNIALREINCSENKLTTLNLSENRNLEDINCKNNQLTSINVQNGKNEIIKSIHAINNINLYCVQVDYVDYSLNNWIGANFSFNSEASFSGNCGSVDPVVKIPDSIFKSILLIDTLINKNRDNQIQKSEAISYSGTINCQNKGIKSLVGIEDFVNINILNCHSNLISLLDLSKNVALTRLYCQKNQLFTLNINNSKKLKELYCSENKLSKLDVSGNPELIQLYCSTNQITKLDVSNNLSLIELYCFDNKLKSIDVKHNIELKELYCYKNEIYYLDFTSNINLNRLYCSNNQLFRLDLRNGNNKNIQSFQARNNPNLTCIQVDDENFSMTNWNLSNFIFDSIVSFSEICWYSSLEDDKKYETSDYTPFPNPTNGLIKFNEIVNVRVSNLMGQIVAETNNTTSIDISNEATGTYIIQYLDHNGQTINQSMIIKE